MEKLGCCQCCSQQPLNEPSTLSVSHMVPRATACLPACPTALLSVARSLSLGGAIPIQCKCDAVKMPHSRPVTGTPTTVVVCVCSMKEKITTTQLPSTHIDTHDPVFLYFLYFSLCIVLLKCLEQKASKDTTSS